MKNSIYWCFCSQELTVACPTLLTMNDTDVLSKYTSSGTPGWFCVTRGLLFIQSCILQFWGTHILQDTHCVSLSHTRLSGFDLKVQLIPLWGALICGISSFLLQAIWYVSLPINHSFPYFELGKKRDTILPVFTLGKQRSNSICFVCIFCLLSTFFLYSIKANM